MLSDLPNISLTIQDPDMIEAMEDARAMAVIKVRDLGVNVIGTKIVGSFPRKGFNAKDIDVLVRVNNINKLKGTKIISGRVDGKNLDIFIEDMKGNKGVFVDHGFYSEFKKLR